MGRRAPVAPADRSPEVRAALERMWPVLTGAELVHDLFSFPGSSVRRVATLLSDEEQSWLYRPRSSDVREVAWTEADLALIDEADALLGSAHRRRRRRDAGAAVPADDGAGGAWSPSSGSAAS